MESLNDEMDDLFRKAGEHYPLKTTDSDWDAVLGRLQLQAGAQYPVGGDEPQKRNNKYRRFLWLLLLLPLGLFSLKYFSGNREENKNIGKTGQTRALPLNKADDQTTKTNRPALSIPSNPENKTSGSMQHPLAPDAANLKGNRPQEFESALSYKSDPLHQNPVANRAGSKQRNSFNEDLNAGSPATDSGNPDDKAGLSSAKNQESLTSKDDAKDHSIQPEKPLQTMPGRDSVNQSGQSQKSNKPEKKLAGKEKGIYLSFLAGPDFSTVKFQTVKNMGYGVGLLIGYRFNKHISLESGVFWDKKQYYSDGEYFNKSKTDIPSTVEIKSLDGDCNMFEVPLSFRYDFSFSRKGRFFATAGLNTYIMKKENYDYSTVSYPGWSRNVSYNNSANNLFSILQLSAGYEYGLGKILRMRIEPYLNIPLKGVGIGNLPISSAGLHLGITLPFR